jgi:hypothetical protein
MRTRHQACTWRVLELCRVRDTHPKWLTLVKLFRLRECGRRRCVVFLLS